MGYLVILVLVAVIGISRLWLQQRREQSQMETIEGFSSVLEAIAPPDPQSHPRGRAARARVAGSLQGWFTARPEPLDPDRRAEVRRRIQARRAAAPGRARAIEVRRAAAAGRFSGGHVGRSEATRSRRATAGAPGSQRQGVPAGG